MAKHLVKLCGLELPEHPIGILFPLPLRLRSVLLFFARAFAFGCAS